jgi:TPP-dependent pyruvate/acetoin dehydrogenase alpha subunit
VALYRVVTECARHARQGNGPSLIDCVRFSAAREADAIEKMEEYLGRKSIVPAESVQQIEAALGKAVRRARKTINE